MALSSSQLEAFTAVATLRNFTQAASQLNITQSALSQRILNLEQTLETTLFLRTKSGVQLTETANELLRYCQSKNTLEDEFLSKLQHVRLAGDRRQEPQKLRGVLRIASYSSILRSVVLPSLAPLLKENPDLKLHVQTKEVYELFELLKRGSVDFIVMNQDLNRPDLEAIEIGEEMSVLVEKKEYRGPDVYLDHDEDDVMTLNYLGVKPENRRFLDDIYGLLDGVNLELGRAVLPRHLLKGQKNLRIVHPRKSLRNPVVIHHFKQAYYSKLHDAAVRELRARAATFLKATD